MIFKCQKVEGSVVMASNDETKRKNQVGEVCFKQLKRA
jgi:hypothetical protein